MRLTLTSFCDSSHSALPVSTSLSRCPHCQYRHKLLTATERRELKILVNEPLPQIFLPIDSLPASGLTPRTSRLDRFFWASPFYVFSFFIILFCLVPCGRLSWLLVNFWAHVNIVHHIISYHIISYHIISKTHSTRPTTSRWTVTANISVKCRRSLSRKANYRQLSIVNCTQLMTLLPNGWRRTARKCTRQQQLCSNSTNNHTKKLISSNNKIPTATAVSCNILI